ncbi:MAG: hypothetical protein KDC14_12490, partial [Planctomycetes bacterium]|nr:hypothetical protein [Planctomycetota bacterium]
MTRTLLGALCLALGSALPCNAQSACFDVPVELRGPLQSVRLEALGVQSELRIGLATGEVRTVSLPFGGGSLAELDPPAAASALRVTTTPAEGSAKVLADDARGPGKAPRAIGRRGHPPVLPARPRPDRARWLLLFGGTVLLVGLRKRPRAAVGAGALTGALIVALPGAPAAGRELRGVDGDFARDQWLEVRSAHERLEFTVGGATWFDVRGGEPARFVVEPTGRATLGAEGGEVHLLRRLEAAPLDPGTGRPVHALREVWRRSADGVWTALADWDPGAAFPAPARPVAEGAGP